MSQASEGEQEATPPARGSAFPAKQRGQSQTEELGQEGPPGCGANADGLWGQVGQVGPCRAMGVVQEAPGASSPTTPALGPGHTLDTSREPPALPRQGGIGKGVGWNTVRGTGSHHPPCTFHLVVQSPEDFRGALVTAPKHLGRHSQLQSHILSGAHGKPGWGGRPGA